MRFNRIKDYIRGKLLVALNKNIRTNGADIFIGKDSSFEVSHRAKLELKGKFNIRKRCSINVRDEAIMSIGKNVFLNNGCEIVSRCSIRIGNNVQIGQNVIIIDHDHDFRHQDGISSGNYRSAEIVISDNVWIGANSVILCGSELGENCIVGAGSVIKGKYNANSLIIQRRE